MCYWFKGWPGRYFEQRAVAPGMRRLPQALTPTLLPVRSWQALLADLAAPLGDILLSTRTPPGNHGFSGKECHGKQIVGARFAHHHDAAAHVHSASQQRYAVLKMQAPRDAAPRL